MIRIGIVGPTWINHRIEHALKMFPNFAPIFKTSNNIYDAPIFTQQLHDQCDVLLYSGYIPYRISKKFIPKHVPAHYVPIKGSSLYRAFYRLRKKVPHFRTVSIDTLSQKEVENINDELNESIHSVLYEEALTLSRTGAIVRFHEQNYNAKQTQCALTGLKVVSDALTDKGIPNEWILPTEEDIIVTLERALLATEQRKKAESQIVVGIVYIENLEQQKRQKASEPHIQRLHLDVNKLILDYVEHLEGYLTALSGNEYIFITTRGIFERVTQGYKLFPLVHDIHKKLQLHVSVGIGFGFSANEAGTHARMALNQSLDFGGQQCFIVKENRSVIGPIKKEVPLTYPLTVTDEKILKKAEKAGISPAYLEKIIAILQRKSVKTFTAQDLANSLGITTRSSHRILLKWLDAGIVKISGMEKVQTRGRPRQVYQLIQWERER